MQPAVVIIGTRHTYQAGGIDCAMEDAEALHKLLSKICQDWNICRIAEEMSCDGLDLYKSSNSVPFNVAIKFNLPHRYCDPTPHERYSLGIGDAELDRQIYGWSDDETKKQSEINDIKREQEWFRRLQEQEIWPTLFVCGSNHVNSFKMLLDSASHPAYVLVEDWKPEGSALI